RGPLLRAPRRAGVLAPGAARPRERAGAAAGDRGGPRGCAGRGAMNAAIEAQAELLRARSFAIFPGLYSALRVERLRAGLLELYHRLGAPPLYAGEPVWLGEDLEVSSTGLVVHKLLNFDRSL